jgi:hypothetical protein
MARAEQPLAEQSAVTVGADLVQRVSSVLSLHPEFAPKVGMWTKLIVAAVQPFVAGGVAAPNASPSHVSGTAANQVPLHDPQQTAIQGFIQWIAESGKPSDNFSLERLNELAGEWVTSHA